MKLSARLRVACAVGAVLALAAGCTSTSADGPTSTAVVSLTVSPSVVGPSTTSPTSSAPDTPSPSVIEPSAPTSASSDISPQEAADRAAVEEQWRRFWQVYQEMVRIPDSQRIIELESVSVDPIKSELLDVARKFEAEGIDYYGSVAHYRYWATPIDGDRYAILRDCMDQSRYGSVYVATGEKRSAGIPSDHIQGGFYKGDDGIWRVQNFQYITDIAC